MKAWLFQDHRQKQKLGEKKCPWSVGWLDPDGNRRSKRIGSKSAAGKFKHKTEGQLAAGTYQSHSRKSWKDFRAEHEQRIADGMEPGTRACTLQALDCFERIIKPKRIGAIKTTTIDDFRAERKTEKGRKGKAISPATVNKELRHIRAVHRFAHDWEYLPKLPKVTMLKVPKKLATYITPEDFAKIYNACGTAKRPANDHFTPGDWWQALLVFSYMTGWRIGEPLALRWRDVSLDKATAITRAEDNKGKRDDLVPLHPIVVEHLRKLVNASIESTPGADLVFYWPHNRRTLWADFCRLQVEAGIEATCGKKESAYPRKGREPKDGESPKGHRHGTGCGLYGFHDLRRAFATCNAERLSADELQAMMRHKSYQTTQGYINMARQLNRTAEALYVPECLKVAD